MVKEIPLSGGHAALVDDADFDRLSDMGTWRSESDGRTHYALHSYRVNGASRRVRMHRLILGLGKKFPLVDHINGNELDNRRSNLRISDNHGNARNRRIGITNTTGFKGVQPNRYCKATGRPWLAVVKANGKAHWMGPFDTREEAALAYDTKARELHGEFAHLNFPEQSHV